MKIKTNKEDLLKATQIAQNVINERNTLPILSNILIETIKHNLRLIATDLDIGISYIFPVDIIEEGAITIPAKRFFNIIKELPDSGITITAKKNNLITIECEKCFFKIMGIPKEEFPKMPEFKNTDNLTLPQKQLKEMLNLTSFAASHDETRYILNGVYFVVKPQNMTLVATDGRRLAMVKAGIVNPSAIDKNIIVPSKAVQELSHNLKDEGEVKIIFADNQIMFEFDNVTIISRLIEGEFPNYEQVVPKESKERLKLDREQFLWATRRASVLTTADSQSIKIDLFKNKMVVSKNTPDLGEAREELDIDYNGQEFSIGFNPGYLTDVLKNLNSPQVSFELTDSEKPGVIRSSEGNYVYIVLPMQLI